MAPELENAPQDKDRRDARSQNEFCSGKQQGTAQRLRLCGVRAAAGTGLLARSFHIETLLRGRVLPPGEWIRRIGRHSEPVRIGYRLAKADSGRRVIAVRPCVGRPSELMLETHSI